MSYPNRTISTSPLDISKKDLSFLERFSLNVTHFGEKCAIHSLENKYTYSELDIISNKLSRYLRDNGIKKGDFVGVCLPSNGMWIIALLAILKLGAIYFPIDPAYPLSNIEYMISKVEPKVILSSHQFENLCSSLGFEYLNIEEVLHKLNQKSKNDKKTNFPCELSPDDLAYIVYTSGSTGNPKGILVSHSNLSHIYNSRNKYYPKNFRGLVSGGICFDASLLVVFYSLMCGGCLCLFDSSFDTNIRKLKKFMNESKVNYMISVPSLYTAFLMQNDKICLKTVSLTGEPLSKNLSLLHAKYAPNTQLLNEYGPSEYAIGTSVARIYNPKQFALNSISIGSPVKHARVYLLDENLRVVPNGEDGEICIAGPGLSRGYFNEPELTLKKFVNLPINGGRVERIYRSGDIGRCQVGKGLQYIGRIEQQTIFNGQKINLGEIERAFLQHPDVTSVVINICTGSRRKEIVACFIATHNISFDELYDFLEKHLAPHLIPLRLIRYKQFPMLPNGKVDRTKIFNAINSENLAKVSS